MRTRRGKAVGGGMYLSWDAREHSVGGRARVGEERLCFDLWLHRPAAATLPLLPFFLSASWACGRTGGERSSRARISYGIGLFQGERPKDATGMEGEDGSRTEMWWHFFYTYILDSECRNSVLYDIPLSNALAFR